MTDINMSDIIDEKVVAGAKSPADIKEDPIVVLTVSKNYFSNRRSLFMLFFFLIFIFLFQERVKSLYLFRDHYFVNHSIDNAIEKSSDVEREMRNALNKFDDYKGYEIDGARAKYYYLKGRALNVVDRYVPQAEELLSKAVKLEPKLVDAWNELGECYWKKDDIQQAKNCFVGALPHVRCGLI